VHGTTITILNAGRRISKSGEGLQGKIFLTSGLGGMSGAQPKAGNIAGCISVVAEVNGKAAIKRHVQGWVDEIITDLGQLVDRVRTAQTRNEVVSLAFHGNVVDVWERFYSENIFVDLGSDQTSLHNPWAGGYYPVGQSFDDSNEMMVKHPDKFRASVQESLRRHAEASTGMLTEDLFLTMATLFCWRLHGPVPILWQPMELISGTLLMSRIL
jgi:urocanate hydratase